MSITPARTAMRRRRGFTLVELIVVIIIIGTLTTIAVPIFLNQRKAAWRTGVISDVKNAALAVETEMTAHDGGMYLVRHDWTGRTYVLANGSGVQYGGMKYRINAGHAVGVTADGNCPTGSYTMVNGDYTGKENNIAPRDTTECVVLDGNGTEFTLGDQNGITFDLPGNGSYAIWGYSNRLSSGPASPSDAMEYNSATGRLASRSGK